VIEGDLAYGVGREALREVEYVANGHTIPPRCT
jgi:hypothetical protein